MTLQEKIAQKLKSLTNQTNNKDSRDDSWKFKPSDGKQIIRLVPNMELGVDSEPFYTIDCYYGIGEQGMIVAPVQFDEPDAIFEFHQQLLNEAKEIKNHGDSDKSLEMWKMAMKFKPKTSIWVPVIVRDREHEGVKFWSISPKTYEKIKAIIDDEDYGNVFDLKSGHDLTVEYTPKTKTSTGYPEIAIMAKPKKTPVSDDSSVILAIKNQPMLMSFFTKSTYDDTKRAIASHLGKEPVATDVNVKSTVGTSKDTINTNIRPSNESIKDFDIDLDELFKD